MFQAKKTTEPSIQEQRESKRLDRERVSQQLAATRQMADEKNELVRLLELQLQNIQDEDHRLHKLELQEEAERSLESDTQELRLVAERINSLSEKLSQAMIEFDSLLHSRNSLLRLQGEQKIMFANLKEVERPNSLKDWWMVLPVVNHRKGEARFTIRYRFRKPNESGEHTDVLKQQRDREKS